MKEKIVGICMCLLLIVTVLPVAQSKQLIPIKSSTEFVDGIIFSQVDFYLGNEIQINSDWGHIQVDIPELTQQIDQGFLNVYTDAGWIVRNEFINRVNGLKYLSMYFDLGVPPGNEIQWLSAYVEFTSGPYVVFQDGPRSEYEMQDKIYAAIGVGDIWQIPLHLVDENPFIPGGETYSFTKPSLNSNENIQTAMCQCFPMAIANSLQYLENQYPTLFNVPHDHIIGLKGDDSLVGQLDTYCDRYAPSRMIGDGVWFRPMMEGKFDYLADNGLSDKLIHKHQGYGYDLPLPPGDFTHADITSKDESVDGKVTFDWLETQLRNCADVEVTKNGHTVRVFGCGKTLEKPYIRYLHDSVQTSTWDPDDTIGLEELSVYVVDLDGDGSMNFGSSTDEILFALAESVKTITVRIPPIFLNLSIEIRILNEGNLPLENERWIIEANGLVFKGQISEGEISIQPGTEEKVTARVFGLGPVSITASVGDTTAKGSCFLLGPLVFFQRGKVESII
jgi:hypothetical protein